MIQKHQKSLLSLKRAISYFLANALSEDRTDDTHARQTAGVSGCRYTDDTVITFMPGSVHIKAQLTDTALPRRQTPNALKLYGPVGNAIDVRPAPRRSHRAIRASMFACESNTLQTMQNHLPRSAADSSRPCAERLRPVYDYRHTHGLRQSKQAGRDIRAV